VAPPVTGGAELVMSGIPVVEALLTEDAEQPLSASIGSSRRAASLRRSDEVISSSTPSS
jgi:hypothetical protein